MPIDQKTLHLVTKRAVSEIIVEQEFIDLLKKGDPLRLKMGFDPSRPDIHLGHAVGLRKLRQLQELGHKLVLIVGDWTAQIGDPSGRSATRPVLTHEEVKSNAESYMRQFFMIVDRSRAEVFWQSEWFGKFTLADVLRLTGRFTVAQILERDDFWKRFQSQSPIAVTEMLYPLLQAYDSTVVRSDVEFGGTDQKFNLLLGRELQRMVGQRPQQCYTVPILVGLDGVQKMSKSLDNYIGVEEAPEQQFGKVMSLKDELIPNWFELLTDVPENDVAEIKRVVTSGSGNPMDLKKRLGEEIVAQFHGKDAAREAREHFESVFQRREVPQDLPVITLAASGQASLVDITRLIADNGLAASRGEAKRLLAQGAVEMDGARVTQESVSIKNGAVLKVGKRKWARVVWG